jgi:hypothetical protein
MEKRLLNVKNKQIYRWLGRSFIFLIAMSFLGCVAAIPVVIYYADKHQGFVVTVQLDVEANKVYQAALEVIENPPKSELLADLIKVTNIKKDNEALSVTFDAIFKEGTHHGKVKVTALDSSRSQLVAVSDTPGDKKADESSALRIVQVVCDKLGVKYKVIKG